MKVGDWVKTIDGKEERIAGIYPEHYGLSTPRDKVYLDGRAMPYYRWQLTPIDDTPEVEREVSRLKWAWGEEQMWVCSGSAKCGNKLCVCYGRHAHNAHCPGGDCGWIETHSECHPESVPAPSPWRKARGRFGDSPVWFSMEIQIEGE